MNKKARDLAKGDVVASSFTGGSIRTVKRIRTYTDVTIVWWVEGDYSTFHKDQQATLVEGNPISGATD